MQPINSVNNVIQVNSINENNVNNGQMLERYKKCKQTAYEYNIREVQSIAGRIAEKLNDPQSFRFFCKVAWRLPEYVIWANLEQAMTSKKNPKAYFTFLCKLSMQTANSQ